jgi:hypothetical protein
MNELCFGETKLPARCGRNGVSRTELTNSPCPVGRQLNRLTHGVNLKDHNTNCPPAEYIAVDFYLKQRLMLADFPHAKLAPYLVSVNNVFPCPTCEFPIARLRVAGYVRVCDCFKNSIGWDADVLSEHACSGGGFQ